MEVDQRTTLNDPVLFAVGQRKYINTFELPHVFGPGVVGNTYKQALKFLYAL